MTLTMRSRVLLICNVQDSSQDREFLLPTSVMLSLGTKRVVAPALPSIAPS